jgi:hypothetical protein
MRKFMVNIEYLAAKIEREREAHSASPMPDRATKQPSRQCCARPDSQADSGVSPDEMPPAT